MCIRDSLSSIVCVEQLPVCCLKQGPAPGMCLLFRVATLTLHERSSLSCVLVSKVNDELFLTILIFLLTTATPIGAIVGGIVAALAVIAVVVVVVIVYRRRRSRK